MKNFNGKAIYQPGGKAGEYSKWACNFYVGCSNGCEYCYCKKGILASSMGQDKPQLKKCFKDEYVAFQIFKAEAWRNLIELEKHGLFFSFTTDPMLPETKELTISAMKFCVCHDIPVKILTKCTDWLEPFLQMIEDNDYIYNKKHLFAFGFTLTGHDELETGAAPNKDRIRAMKVLSSEGFKTFASIEPIIDFDSSWSMIVESFRYCDLLKIGLESGKKYDVKELIDFAQKVTHFLSGPLETKVYWKDSIFKAMGVQRENAGLPKNCVTRDFNIFNH